MPHDEFLRLLQATESQRACVGQECFAVTDGNVDVARDIERTRSSHEGFHEKGARAVEVCDVCRGIREQTIALREALHTQGIDFPVEVFAVD